MGAVAYANTNIVNIEFKKENVKIHKDGRNLYYVIYNGDLTAFDITGYPAIPYFSLSHIVPQGSKVKSVKAYGDSIVLEKGIKLQEVQEEVVLGTKPTYEVKAFSKDSMLKVENCRYVASSNVGDESIAHIAYSPFAYDANNETLYFIEKLNIAIEYDVESKKNKQEPVEQLWAPTDPISSNNLPILRGRIDDIVNLMPVDYLIVTVDSLKSAFEPLAKWKTTKGVYAMITTIDALMANSTDSPLDIKNRIFSFYKNFRPHYVLLGGDDEIIPARKCKIKVSGTDERDIPTDIYYACFDTSTFDWDQNQNGLYGEYIERNNTILKDSVNLIPNMYVSRAPVRTINDAKAFVDKVLDYEINHTPSNSFLTTGGEINRSDITYDEDDKTIIDKHSDAEMWGDELFSNVVSPNYTGKWDRFYNTDSSFPGGKDYVLDETNFNKVLSNGYDYISLFTHGYHNYVYLEWITATKSRTYKIEDVANLNNKGKSVLTTIACLTNAFDTWVEPKLFNLQHKDPCLSEAFLRSPNSGIVAYLGCSREGWSQPYSPTHGASYQFEESFYKNLFNNISENKNFAKIVTDAKLNLIAAAYFNPSYRWIFYGLNAMGDPEMPLYTGQINAFNNVSFTYNAGQLTVNTGVYDSKICITGTSSRNNSYNVFIGRTCTQDISNYSSPNSAIVTVTKQNYRPRSYYVTVSTGANKLIVQEIFSIVDYVKTGTIQYIPNESNIRLQNTYIEDNKLCIILNDKPNNDLTLNISSATGFPSRSYSISNNKTTIDISDFPAGIIALSLNSNGQYITSKTIQKR